MYCTLTLEPRKPLLYKKVKSPIGGRFLLDTTLLVVVVVVVVVPFHL